jgi:hypothetical protein
VSVGPLPIVCAWCQRVRSTAGRWEETESVDLDATAATHGICPECLAEETRAAADALEVR